MRKSMFCPRGTPRRTTRPRSSAGRGGAARAPRRWRSPGTATLDAPFAQGVVGGALERAVRVTAATAPQVVDFVQRLGCSADVVAGGGEERLGGGLHQFQGPADGRLVCGEFVGLGWRGRCVSGAQVAAGVAGPAAPRGPPPPFSAAAARAVPPPPGGRPRPVRAPVSSS